MVTVPEVREVAARLPRTTEHLIHDRVKFRVGKIVYVAFSRDETVMGFAFPKEQRDSLVAAQPKVFHLPKATDLRFNWVQASLAELEHRAMAAMVIDAWRTVVPRRVAAAYVAGHR